MTKFVNENMTTEEQVNYAWENKCLFERCQTHNYKVMILRLTTNSGRYISGWEVDAEQLLKDYACPIRCKGEG